MQGELFCGMEKNIRHTEELEEEQPIEKSSVFDRFQITLSFDKVVISTISLVVLLTITFAMGVEKGKQKAAQASAALKAESSEKVVIQQEWSQTSETQDSSDFDSTQQNDSTPVEATDSYETVASTITPTVPVIPQATEAENKRYRIQLVTYLKRSAAQRTSDQLQKKGYDSYVKQSGKYFVLNVGPFIGKQDAEQVLPRLRKELGLNKEGIVRNFS